MAVDHRSIITRARAITRRLTWEQDDTAQQALDDFILPTDQIPSFNQLMNIFTNNLDIRDILAEGMKNADNKRVYEMFSLLYDSLMIMQLTMDHFSDPETGELYRDEDGNATYQEFLRHKDPILYYKLVEIDLIDDHDSKIQQIGNLIDSAVFALEEYIDSEKFSGIFHHLPVVSVDAIKEYIQMVIDFYKSYKVHFLGVNTLYTYDDKFDGWVRIIDDIFEKNVIFWKDDVLGIHDHICKQFNEMTKEDKIAIRERIFMDISTWKYFDFVDRAWLEDLILFLTRYFFDDKVLIEDRRAAINSIFGYEDIVPMLDVKASSKVTMTLNDYIGIRDIIPEYSITNT